MFGLKITGNAGNLILGDGKPVLVAVHSGSLTVTTAAPRFYTQFFNGADSNAAHYGYCEVTYPKPIRTAAPPFVFAVPTPGAQGGLGLFCHLGSGGAWTGFRVLFSPKLDYKGGYTPAVGMNTGWRYRACTFGTAPSSEKFGMRTWNEDGELTFDSSWAVVPFRGLLRQWTKQGGGKYGGNDSNANHYWGSFYGSQSKDLDTAYEVYSHPWGAPDGSLGVLISSLSTLHAEADTGFSDPAGLLTVPLVGFLGSGRSAINASVMFGMIQHAGTVYPAMNGFALLTADFTGA